MTRSHWQWKDLAQWQVRIDSGRIALSDKFALTVEGSRSLTRSHWQWKDLAHWQSKDVAYWQDLTGNGKLSLTDKISLAVKRSRSLTTKRSRLLTIKRPSRSQCKTFTKGVSATHHARVRLRRESARGGAALTTYKSLIDHNKYTTVWSKTVNQWDAEWKVHTELSSYHYYCGGFSGSSSLPIILQWSFNNKHKVVRIRPSFKIK